MAGAAAAVEVELGEVVEPNGYGHGQRGCRGTGPTGVNAEWNAKRRFFIATGQWLDESNDWSLPFGFGILL